MRVVHRDESVPVIKLKPESIEDLWYLSKIVDEGDEAEGHSERRYKPPGATRDSGEKKQVTIRLKAEQVEFAESANKLRITGVIVSGTPEEYVPKGDHHTLDVAPHEPIKLFKKLSLAERKVLDEAVQHSTHAKALILLMDDRKALAALIQARGTKVLFERESGASKRNPKEFEAHRTKFYMELTDAIEATDADAIFIAGPGFEKNTFQKYLQEKKPKIFKKASFDYASSAEKSALRELLAKGAVEKAIGNKKQAEELEALEKLKASISKSDGWSVYGPAEVKDALKKHAVETLLVMDAFIRSKEGHEILSLAETEGVQLLAFTSDGEAGQEFSAYNVAAFLRFKLR